jgi:hypothetical protein
VAELASADGARVAAALEAAERSAVEASGWALVVEAVAKAAGSRERG